MIACVDVDYLDTRAVAAGIAFRDWPDDSIVAERVVSLPGIHPYKSGQFFIRELVSTGESNAVRKRAVTMNEVNGNGLGRSPSLRRLWNSVSW